MTTVLRPALPADAIPPARTRVLLTVVARREAGLAPLSLRELAADLGRDLSTVAAHVTQLRADGLLEPAARSAQRVTASALRVVAHTPEVQP